MTDKEFSALVIDVRTHTQLARLNHDETAAVFDRLAALGFDWRDWQANVTAKIAVDAASTAEAVQAS